MKKEDVSAGRDYLFDNIKGVLIFLVVLVHLYAAVRGNYGFIWIIDGGMLVACSFHMPLFMFITGYFAKRNDTKKIDSMIIQYLLIQILFLAYDVCFCDRGAAKLTLWNYISPGFSMWYFVACILLRMTIPLVQRMKHPIVVLSVCSVLIMNAPMRGNIEVTIVKTIANAVYFYLGLMASEKNINEIRRIDRRVYAILFLLAALFLYMITFRGEFMESEILRQVCLRGKNINELEMGNFGYMIYLMTMLFAIFMSVLVIGFMPKNKTWISKWGKNSLTIYFAQAFVYMFCKDFFRIEVSNLWIVYIAAFIFSVLCCAIFGSELINSAYKKLVGNICNALSL